MENNDKNMKKMKKKRGKLQFSKKWKIVVIFLEFFSFVFMFFHFFYHVFIIFLLIFLIMFLKKSFLLPVVELMQNDKKWWNMTNNW